MNCVNQISHYTEYNRYPKHFEELREITKDKGEELEILSFGCSTGEEVRTLSEIYFKNARITGYDISKKIIDLLNKENKNERVRYINDIDEKEYDIVICMSVLCRWPESMGEYKKEEFDEVIKGIDEIVKEGGYVCIYNSKYIIDETKEYERYERVKTKVKDSGFVRKYRETGEEIKGYPYYLYKKERQRINVD